MRFTFDMKKIRESGMLEWSQTHECKTPYVDEVPKKPILWLVKDSGVYLMAGTKERQLASTKGAAKCVVVYAEGFEEGEHIGGDDLVESIDLAFVLKCKAELNISLTSDEIRLQGK